MKPIAAITLACMLCVYIDSRAQLDAPPDEDRTIGQTVVDAELVDEHGNSLRVSDLAGKPLIVSPIFLSCPHACPMITESLRAGLSNIGQPGEHYNILSVSFDPADTIEDLRSYRENLALPDGWILAVSPNKTLDAFLESLDFNYSPVPGGGFAHANIVAFLTPDQTVSQYLHGLSYEEIAIRRALMTASSGPSLVAKYRGVIFAVMAIAALALALVIIATGQRKSSAAA
jgi:protein SCO1/2